MSLPIRLGVVSYLNSEPLVWGLEHDPGFAIVRDVPSRVAELLHAGEVDLGLVPSIEYARARYAIVPGIAIASRGPVRSVSLFHRGSIGGVRRVALDRSSRASVALAKVLLHDLLAREPEYVEMPPSLPGMLDDAEAALVIGDPALYFDGDLERTDLGEEWRRATGLPFVFAFWAGRQGVIGADVVRRLQAAKAAGLEAVPRIAASYNGLGRGRSQLNESYLRSNIVYDFGEPERAGLREFFRRAAALGLIDGVPELRFHGDP